jgi:ribosome assembly protein YihI (activator of Der GTPase)
MGNPSDVVQSDIRKGNVGQIHRASNDTLPPNSPPAGVQSDDEQDCVSKNLPPPTSISTVSATLAERHKASKQVATISSKEAHSRAAPRKESKQRAAHTVASRASMISLTETSFSKSLSSAVDPKHLSANPVPSTSKTNPKRVMSKAKVKEASERLTPAEYATKITTELLADSLKCSEVVDGPLKGKAIYYYGGNRDIACDVTKKRMDIVSCSRSDVTKFEFSLARLQRRYSATYI